MQELKERVKEVAGEDILRAVEAIENDYEKMYIVATLTNNISLKLKESHFEAFVNTFLSKDNLLISVDGLPPMALGRDYTFELDEENDIFIIQFNATNSSLVKLEVTLNIVNAVKTGNVWQCTVDNDDDYSNIILYDAVAI